ncbi:hypothetical protein DCO44_06955 [Acinetobacter sp. AM]|uniref:hypothetical protein n=1 Tax=Acinetobacter sp. AM TaxID=2170730 RepID=UPI000DE779A0|nr:hypothetical protein [Acinetobacter sp. AM]PWB15056.1 hypothetical protein DCO44_06955 [Acinetobacter sp. AM]
MPHIEIHYYPKEIDKIKLIDETLLLTRKIFNVNDDTVSISLIEVIEENWFSSVVKSKLITNRKYLIKEPGYVFK